MPRDRVCGWFGCSVWVIALTDRKLAAIDVDSVAAGCHSEWRYGYLDLRD